MGQFVTVVVYVKEKNKEDSVHGPSYRVEALLGRLHVVRIPQQNTRREEDGAGGVLGEVVQVEPTNHSA